MRGAAAPERSTSPRAGGHRGLIVAFCVLVVAFLGATAFSQYWAVSVESPAIAIHAWATESIRELAATSAALSRVAGALDAELHSEDPAAAAADVERARADLATPLARYRRLPGLPGEDVVWRRAERRLAEMDRLLRERARAEAPAERAATHAKLQMAVEHLEAELASVIDFNAVTTRRSAERIRGLRRDAALLAWGLDGVAVGAALVSGVLVLRGARRAARIVEEHRRLQELRIEELDAFGARVAHDIRGPLQGVGLALELIARQDRDAASQVPVRRARASLERVGEVVDALLAFARAGAPPGDAPPAAVHEVLAAVVDDAADEAEAASAELVLEPLEPCTVACPAGVLTSIASNLVRNAIRYLGQRPERRVTVRAQPRGESVHLEVEDTGPGIPPALQEVVFEPHVRGPGSGGPGLGLGLATVRRLAVAHHGDVGFETAAGRGTLFWVDLPRADAAVRHEQHKTQVASAPAPAR